MTYVVAGGPVIPNYGKATGCIADNNSFFCTKWIHQHWSDTLQPALIQHVYLTAIAVGIGFAIAFVFALAAHRFNWLAPPISVFTAFLYTVPSIALFQVLVPITGITVTTIEIGLVGYTLLVLFGNTLAGLRSVPPDVIEAARGMVHRSSTEQQRAAILRSRPDRSSHQDLRATAPGVARGRSPYR